jgi:hypothetical protein
MKKLLTTLALFLLVSAATFAQTRYTIVAYHKLQPGKTIDDAIANEKQWLPIHQARKTAGIISDWMMYVPYNGIKSEGIDFDYMTVNGGTDLDKIHTYPMELFADLLKADPGFAKLAAATNKTQTIIRQSISKRVNGTAKGTNKSQFLVFDFMKVGDDAAYEAFEAKFLKVHEARIEAGNITGWSLYKAIYPNSADVSMNYTTIQSFDKLSKVDQAWDSYLTAIPKALGVSAETIMKQAPAQRTLGSTMITTVALSTK